MTKAPAELDPQAILRVLLKHEVRFLVMGGIAGALYGSTTLTADLDVLYDRDRANITRLARALDELRARRRDVAASLPAGIDERGLLSGTNFLLTTTAGDLDCIGETPSGRFTYAQLAPTSERFELGRGVVVLAVSLEDLIRMKRATGRAKDAAEVETLAALREVRDGRR